MYLLVGVECDMLCGAEAGCEESREAKHQTKEVQTHQSDDLFRIHNAQLDKAAEKLTF